MFNWFNTLDKKSKEVQHDYKDHPVEGKELSYEQAKEIAQTRIETESKYGEYRTKENLEALKEDALICRKYAFREEYPESILNEAIFCSFSNYISGNKKLFINPVLFHESTIQDLPNDLLGYIFSFFGSKRKLGAIACTNKKFSLLTKLDAFKNIKSGYENIFFGELCKYIFDHPQDVNIILEEAVYRVKMNPSRIDYLRKILRKCKVQGLMVDTSIIFQLKVDKNFFLEQLKSEFCAPIEYYHSERPEIHNEHFKMLLSNLHKIRENSTKQINNDPDIENSTIHELILSYLTLSDCDSKDKVASYLKVFFNGLKITSCCPLILYNLRQILLNYNTESDEQLTRQMI